MSGEIEAASDRKLRSGILTFQNHHAATDLGSSHVREGKKARHFGSGRSDAYHPSDRRFAPDDRGCLIVATQ